MNKISKLIFLILLQIIINYLGAINFFSPIIKKEIFFYKQNKSEYKLNFSALINNSETIKIDSLKLIKDVNYSINYQKGILKINSNFKENSKINITYKIIPKNILRKYSLFKKQIASDTTEIKLNKNFNLNSDDDSVINISGSKSISVTIGNNQDLTIDQSMFLTLDGEISKGMNIEAQLSDSSIPLTEEGNSEQLSNLDRIFIKIYTKKLELAFGDLDFEISKTKLIDYKTRVEGLKFKYFDKNYFSGAIAISKGKKKSVTFNGQNGVQGPYYLSLRTENSAIKVISGSEKIYLDGVKISRGSDYSIDYNEGSIIFTNNHLISNNSHIQADYQYSDENYKQNIYLYSMKLPLNKMFTISSGMIYQIDDKENPLNLILSQDDLDSLSVAGDNSAWGNGIFESDSGNYNLETDDSGEIYYEYVGNGGHFNIYFSYVGEGKGDYTQTGIGKYEYVGKENGSWLPRKNLPLPEKKMNFDFGLKSVYKSFSIYNEILLSNYDKNLFSPLDDGDNAGVSTFTSAEFTPDWDNITSKYKVFYNYFSKNISTFSQLNSSENNYLLNQMTKSDSLQHYEIGGNFFGKFKSLKNNFRFIKKKSKNYLKDDLFENKLSLSQKNFIPEIKWNYLIDIQDIYKSKKYSHLLQNNNLSSKYKYKFVYLKLANEFQKFEDKVDKQIIGGNKKIKNEISLGTESKLHTDFSYTTNHNKKYENFWQNDYQDYIWSGKSFYNGLKNDIQINYSHQKIKDYSSENQDGNYDIAEITSNQRILNDGLILNENYTLKNIKFYPKERQLIYVGNNSGIYDSTGVVVENGDYIYEMVNIGNSELTTELNLNLKANIIPRQFSKNEILRKIQSESTILITENSKADNKWHIYFLDPKTLMNKETSIYSRQIFEQSLWYEIIKRKLTLHSHVKYSKSLDNRYTESQTTKETNYDSDLRFKERLNNEYHLYYENRNAEDSRYKSIIKNQNIRLENRFRYNNCIFTTSFEAQKENDNYNSGYKVYTINGYKIREQININLAKKYRIFSDISWKRNNTKGDVENYFYEKQAGNIFEWSLNFNYRMNRNTNIIANYHGNSYPNRIAENYLGLEIHANF